MKTCNLLSTILFFLLLFNLEESVAQKTNHKPGSSSGTAESLGDIIYKSYFNNYEYNISTLDPLESFGETWSSCNLPDCEAAYSVAIDTINRRLFVGTWQSDTLIGPVCQTALDPIISGDMIIWHNLAPIPGDDHTIRLEYHHPTNSLYALGLNSPYRYLEPTNTWKKFISPVEIYRTFDMQQGSDNRIFVCFQKRVKTSTNSYFQGWMGQIVPGQDTLQNLNMVDYTQNVQTITEAPDGALYVVGGDLSYSWLFKSTNNGVTWTREQILPEPGQFAWSMYPDSIGANPIIWLATNFGVYKYNPMGIVKMRPDGLPADTRCIAISPNDTIYAGTSGIIGADLYKKLAVWQCLGVDIDLITAWDILFFERNALLVGTERIVHPSHYYYKGEMWFRTNFTQIEPFGNVVPEGFALKQNYPNPFNPSTVISWQLPVAGPVKLSVYNVAGEKVATVVNGNFSAGLHSVEWNAPNLASGVYLYTLETDRYVLSRKMVLMK